MAKITHNISTPNDGLGDQLRLAFDHQNQMNTELYDTKVDKVTGLGLSQNNFTNTLLTKLNSINAYAEVNIQADWSQEDGSAKNFIKNKPEIPIFSLRTPVNLRSVYNGTSTPVGEDFVLTRIVSLNDINTFFTGTVTTTNLVITDGVTGDIYLIDGYTTLT